MSLQPTVQFETLVRAIETLGGGPQLGREATHPGLPPLEQVFTLIDVLAKYDHLRSVLLTTTPEQCWFGVWDGYGWLYGRAAMRPLARTQAQAAHPAVASGVESAPRVHLPNRDYLLYGGPLVAAAAFATTPWQQTPNLWWPADRTWCIASEIDLTSTYIGGAQALVDHVLADARFEAVAAQLTDTIAADGPG